ncbi:MAG: cyclodeaminase/cyclohydrolase family protein [Solirubrobacteraceae bacterium]
MNVPVAAALAEMAVTIALHDEEAGAGVLAAVAKGRDRAQRLRRNALELADADAIAYQAVVAAGRQDVERAKRLRAALRAAADPPLAIAELAEPADAIAEHARGGVRGEAAAAAILAEAAAAACVPMLQLNLAGNPDDPRLARGSQLAAAAAAQCRTRTTSRLRSPRHEP